MKHTLFALCALVLAATMPAMAQKPITKKQWKKTTCVVYTYHSGSAIDPNKRDYTVCVNKDSIIVRVSAPDGSGGSMVFESSAEQFNSLKAQLAAQGLGYISPDKVGAIPLGGGSESIECFAGDDAYYEGYWSDRIGTLTLKKGYAFDAFDRILPMPINEIIHAVAPPKPPVIRQPLIRRITLSPEQWEEVDFVRYSFTDASLPPEYHRSYSIGIDKDSVVVKVWSYGSLLLHEAYPFTQEQFEEVKQQLIAQGFSSGKPSDEPMPTGGTEDAVGFFCGEKCLFSASAYAGIGTLFIEKGGAASAFLKALPEPIETIIDRTRIE